MKILKKQQLVKNIVGCKPYLLLLRIDKKRIKRKRDSEKLILALASKEIVKHIFKLLFPHPTTELPQKKEKDYCVVLVIDYLKLLQKQKLFGLWCEEKLITKQAMEDRFAEKKAFTRYYFSSTKILVCLCGTERQKSAVPIDTGPQLKAKIKHRNQIQQSGKKIKSNTILPTSPQMFFSLHIFSITISGLGDNHHGRLFLKRAEPAVSVQNDFETQIHRGANHYYNNTGPASLCLIYAPHMSR